MTLQTTRVRSSYRPFEAELLSVDRISPTFRRLRFTGPHLDECADTLLDQRIKLVLADAAGTAALAGSPDWQRDWTALRGSRPVMRTYTVAGVDRAWGIVDVDVACYPVHGPVSQFAREAIAGDRLLLIGPDARSELSAVEGLAWRPGRCSEVLIVGDETTLPAVRNILASLPRQMAGLVVIEVPHRQDADGLVTEAGGVNIVVLERGLARVGERATDVVRQWMAGRALAVPRQMAAPEAADRLLWDEAVGECAGTYAWLAGEARWLAGLRRELLSLGVVQRNQASFMGYWRQGAVLE